MTDHDHKGYSEEKCVRCGWVMGRPPLNCNNDNTPHVFPSQMDVKTLRVVFDIAVGSLDFSSGFLDDEEVAALRSVAKFLGVDPREATPSSFQSKYDRDLCWRCDTRVATTDLGLCEPCREAMSDG